MDATPLLARDLMCPHWRRVTALQRFRDVAAPEGGQFDVFAVYDEAGAYLGLVTARQAALFPGRLFADLLIQRQARPLPSDSTVETVLQRLQTDAVDYLPVADGQGVILGVVSRLSVVSRLCEHERALREERDRLVEHLRCELEHREVAASVFDGMLEGIMVTDAQMCILLVNHAFSEVTGYSLDEVAGKTPRLLQSGRHDAEFYRRMWQAIGQSGMWEGEIWNRRKSGEVYPEWLRIQRVTDAQGVVRYYVGIFSDISQHQEMRAKLLHLAYYDTLTGLANRQLLDDRLQQAIAHGRRSGEGFALLYLDLDRFKDLNDTRGHRFGDQVLSAVAHRLIGCLRAADTVARLGGDEFVILLADTVEPPAVAETAQKLIDRVMQPLEVGGEQVHLGASIGISRFPDDGQDADTLLMKADAAMYQAKAQGRGRYHFHSDALHDRLRQRIALAQQLRGALHSGGLWLAWQPIVRLADRKIVGAEALARWQQADGTPVSPAEFIPIAEEAGFMDALGSWALERLAEEGKGLLAACPEPLRLGLNFSALQLRPGQERRLLEGLRRLGFPARHLTVELTETALSLQREGADTFLRALEQDGVEIAVDDFGTGCSNLAMLKQLPIHKLKIDRSFVQDLPNDSNDRQIAVAMIRMAHALGLKVVAEGVETEAQAELLTTLECDYAQGYLFGRPMTLAHFLALV